MSVKALVTSRPGVAEIHAVPYPTIPTPNHVMVQVKAVAVNPSDWKHVDLEGEDACTGCVVGLDYAGVVVKTGSDAGNFKKGDRVAGTVNGSNPLFKEEGAFAEYIAAIADRMLRISPGMTFAQASTLGTALGTIFLCLYRGLGLPFPSDVDDSTPSTTLLIYGGSTAMGITAIQFAKLSKATVIATCSPSNFAYLKSLGADYVLDYNSETLVDEIRSAANGPVDLAADCWSNDETATHCAQALKPGGTYSSLYLSEEAAKTANPNISTHFTFAYSLFDRPSWFFGRFEPDPAEVERFKSFLPLAEKLLTEGKVKPPKVFLNRTGDGLEGLIKGLDESRKGNVRAGKLVFTL